MAKHLALVLGMALAALIVMAAGCGGSAGTTTTLDDAGASALYAADLGKVVSDATAIERAAASVASNARAGQGSGGQGHQHQMGDGSGFDVGEGGEYHVYCPDGTEVTGTPNGPRQIRMGDTILDAEWELIGNGDTQRLRIHLRDGSECLVGEPDGNGEMECEGPNQWRFRARIQEDGGIELRFGQQLISVEPGADGTLVVDVQGHGRWSIVLQDDGSYLVSNPAGHAMYTIVIGEDGTLTVTSTNSGQSYVVDPGEALPGDAV